MNETQENTGEKKGNDTNRTIFYGLNLCQLVKFMSVLRAFLRPTMDFFPVLASLLFLGALFWAKGQDPFSRKWFTLHPHLPAASSPVRTGEQLKCVAVLPKPIRPCPVVIYAHGSGGTLMNDGFELRQMAEMGLAVVSIEYNLTNEIAFVSEMEAVSQYIARQKWSDTNAIAWVGFSLGANRLLDFALQHPNQQPQLLVLLSGRGLDPSSILYRPSSSPMCPVLLIHGEQDEIFPVADTERFAAELQSNQVPVDLKILPGFSHGMEPDRGVVFRSIGEYCRAHLLASSSRLQEAHASKLEIGNQKSEIQEGAWQNYHSIAQWQAEAPGLVWFWIPAAAWAIGGFIRFQRHRNKAVAQTFLSAGSGDFPVASFPGDGRAKGRPGAGEEETTKHGTGKSREPAGLETCATSPPSGKVELRRHEIALRWVAGILAVWALTETGLHLMTPHFQVSERTLAIARSMLVQDKERTDFEALAGRPIWREQKLKTLLDHVELAVYNRELINWQLDQTNYENYVLSPVITGEAGERLDWRRPLWEEFYPPIRHESSAEDAARIVVRHLRERVTVVAGPNLPHEVPDIWRRQLTDQTGFEIIYVAALRSVGVSARLDSHHHAELFNDGKWQTAPDPVVLEAWK